MGFPGNAQKRGVIKKEFFGAWGIKPTEMVIWLIGELPKP